jgi:hypothetical protein
MTYLKVTTLDFLEGLRETAKTLSQNSSSPGRHLVQISFQHEAGVLATTPRFRQVVTQTFHMVYALEVVNMEQTDENFKEFLLRTCSLT